MGNAAYLQETFSSGGVYCVEYEFGNKIPTAVEIVPLKNHTEKKWELSRCFDCKPIMVSSRTLSNIIVILTVWRVSAGVKPRNDWQYDGKNGIHKHFIALPQIPVPRPI